jgi:outer membrane protein assembly factor BamB
MQPRGHSGPPRPPNLAALPSCGQASATPTAAATTPDATGGTSDGSDRPTYGQNASRTGYSSKATAISAANLSQRAPLWPADIGIGDFPPSGALTLTVAWGRVFVGSSVADCPHFFAFDAATGEAPWTADLGHTKTVTPLSTSSRDWTRYLLEPVHLAGLRRQPR